jgi:hypothetical protein
MVYKPTKALFRLPTPLAKRLPSVTLQTAGLGLVLEVSYTSISLVTT